MIMKINKIFTAFCFSILALSSLTAQNTNTLYFMEQIPERNNMNPAFIPTSKFYFDFVVLPNLYIGLGNNDVALKDLIYNKDGKTQTVWSSPDNVAPFINSLKPTTVIDEDIKLSLLSLGFQFKEKNYLTFGLNLRENGTIFMPRDFSKFLWQGTPDSVNVNSFNFSSFGADFTIYSELALGYMREINDKWTFGGKAKLLMGYADIYSDVTNLSLDASRENWTLHSDATIRGSLPVIFGQNEDNSTDITNISPLSTDEYIKLLYNPAGLGAAIDLGVTYKPIKPLTLSAAILDLGFIHWSKYNVKGTMTGDHVFDGFGSYNSSNDSTTNNLEKLGNDLKESLDFTDNASAYTRMITATANIGAEYGILNNKISFGLLSSTKFNSNHLWEEITASANFRPADWFNTSLSYSLTNGRFGTFGLGLNMRVGIFNMFLISDYVPVNYTTYPIETNDGNNTFNLPLPYASQKLNVQTGLTWTFGKRGDDTDHDGVKNKKDLCPGTDIDFLMEKCPDLKKKQIVDKKGCPFDEDKDGVADCYDKCPGTPEGVAVDEVGCPIDSDNDGVVDNLDKCPNTPEGVIVDENGCPLDKDGDGVPDYKDKCPNTPQNVLVDSIGCPIDSDHDGVVDYLDKCPNTPAGVKVDANGCAADADKDGVPDNLDKCPNTPLRAPVDSVGCPLDTDGDGIPDYKDKCPTVAGIASNQGCPELQREVRNLFKQAMHGIQFETGKSDIKKVSYPILDKIVTVMKENPTYLLAINGHTDDVGSDELNLKLSQDRANAVKQYLIDKGISESRLTAQGFGETQPVADNKTALGRAQNRRVEFEITYESVTYEKVNN